MNNEEVKAVFDSINSLEDAYQLACKNGYTGDHQDFADLIAKVAGETSKVEMDLNDMAQVAGGGEGNIIDNVVDWCKENKAAAITIGASAVVTAAAIGFGVYAYKNWQPAGTDNSQPAVRPGDPGFVRTGKGTEVVKFTWDPAFQQYLINNRGKTWIKN